jgi:hypothetical protein
VPRQDTWKFRLFQRTKGRWIFIRRENLLCKARRTDNDDHRESNNNLLNLILNLCKERLKTYRFSSREKAVPSQQDVVKKEKISVDQELFLPKNLEALDKAVEM